MNKGLRLGIIIAIIAIAAIIIFYPKESYTSSSGIWDTDWHTYKECSCLGVEYDANRMVLDAGSRILCFGIVSDCKCYRMPVKRYNYFDFENMTEEEQKQAITIIEEEMETPQVWEEVDC